MIRCVFTAHVTVRAAAKKTASLNPSIYARSYRTFSTSLLKWYIYRTDLGFMFIPIFRPFPGAFERQGEYASQTKSRSALDGSGRIGGRSRLRAWCPTSSLSGSPSVCLQISSAPREEVVVEFLHLVVFDSFATGNGHPLSAVVTTPEIAKSFHSMGIEFFSTVSLPSSSSTLTPFRIC